MIKDNCIIIFVVVVADLHWHLLWLNKKTCTRSVRPVSGHDLCIN